MFNQVMTEILSHLTPRKFFKILETLQTFANVAQLNNSVQGRNFIPNSLTLA